MDTSSMTAIAGREAADDALDQVMEMQRAHWAQFTPEERQARREAVDKFADEHPVRHCDLCDNDDLVGWSICDDCFHSDPYDGPAYWTPMFCALILLVAVGFFVAAMMELAR